MKRTGAVIWLAVWALAGPPPGARALGLRSPAKEIVVEGLEPGKSYSLRELTGSPLTLQNAGAEEIELELSGGPPSAQELKDGYEPVPAGRWLEIARPRHALAAGESAASDATLMVPRGSRVEGGRFQLNWVARARDSGGRSLSLASRLLLHVSPQPAGGGGVPPLEGLRPLSAAAGSRGVTVKAAYLGEAPRRLRAVPVEATDEGLEPGWERAPNPGFLAPGRWETVAPDAVVTAELRLRIPEQERYRGRRWAFTVAFEDEDGARSAPLRVLVTTPGRRTR